MRDSRSTPLVPRVRAVQALVPLEKTRDFGMTLMSKFSPLILDGEQLRAPAWEKRMRCDLAFESLRPAAGDCG